MTLQKFINQNRKEIDNYIKSINPGNRTNDEERRLWILNDESLYNWAKSERVRNI